MEITQQQYRSSSRVFLNALMALLVLTGMVILSWPFMSSLAPNQVAIDNFELEVDLSAMVPGDVKRVSWEPYGEVFILRRNARQLEQLQDYVIPELHHELDEYDRQHAALNGKYRSFNKEFLVVSAWSFDGKGIALREFPVQVIGCKDFRFEHSEFYCARYYWGEPVSREEAYYVYDITGRSQSRWIMPLAIPRHSFINDTTIVLGRDNN